jgi:hypothetical protein
VYGLCYNQAESLANFLGGPPDQRIRRVFDFVAKTGIFVGAFYYYWYMDENCNYVVPSSNDRICGFSGVAYSPLSLLWNGKDTEISGGRLAEFSLSGSPEQRFSVWKASEAAPLVVYDPQHSGQVTSVRQLFGNYTFGGITSQPQLDDAKPLGAPWQNGYEALALLDSNRDGVIAGEELEPLALWFDRDRDAVVDPGEMMVASESGLQELFYQGARRNDGERDFSLSRGFVREADGEKISGTSINWYGEAFTSQQEALSALTASPRAPVASSVARQEKQEKVVRSTAPVNHATDITGHWVWNILEKDGELNPGLLILKQDGEKVGGYALSESRVANGAHRFRSVISTIPVEGSVVTDENGQRVLTLRGQDEYGTQRVTSSVSISPDGTMMRGHTTQSSKLDVRARGEVIIEYEWAGSKILSDPKTESGGLRE